jgi:Domain of unknown function (DUF4328)
LSSTRQALSRFATLRARTRLVVGLLLLDILLAWLTLMGVGIFVTRVWHGLAGETLGYGSLAQHIVQFEAVRTLQGLVWLATAVAFLAWIHRAYANLERLGVKDLGYAPPWAVGAFVVPLLNLIHPLRVVRELWNASDEAGTGETMSRRGTTSPWLLSWWGLLVASVAVDPFALRPFESPERSLDLAGGTSRVVAGALLEMAAAALAVFIAARITRGQERRFEGRAPRAESTR